MFTFVFFSGDSKLDDKVKWTMDLFLLCILQNLKSTIKAIYSLRPFHNEAQYFQQRLLIYNTYLIGIRVDLMRI